MNLVKIIPLLASILGVPAGCVYLYETHYPKDIQAWISWKGEKIIEEDQIYKAIFIDNKEDLKSKSIITQDDLSKGWEELKTWCNDTIKKPKFTGEEWEKSYKYCIQKNNLITTAKGQLVKNKHSSFEKDITEEEYKTIFAVYKFNSGFLNSIKGSDATITQTTPNDTGKNTLKNWCESELKKTTFENLGKVKAYCSPLTYTTVEDKLKAEKTPVWEKITEDEKWKEQFEKWKNTESITSAIGSDVNKDTDKDTGGPKMKTWCEEQLKKKLHEENVYQDIYSKVKSACKKDSK